MEIFTLLTPSLDLSLTLTSPVGPARPLKAIPAVHGIPANTDGNAQEVLYDRMS
jgi:hypothetical protein